jgi:hypothetical protein
LVVSTAAFIVAGCSHGYDSRRCIDATGRVLSDNYCQQGIGAPYGYSGAPHWVYGGSGYYSGGHYFWHNYSSSSRGGSYGGSGGGGGVSRGGFGGSGSGGGS